MKLNMLYVMQQCYYEFEFCFADGGGGGGRVSLSKKGKTPRQKFNTELGHRHSAKSGVTINIKFHLEM